MSISSIEIVVITGKAADAQKNRDNVNMNGKVLSLQDADKGYKAAGSFAAPCLIALASSSRDGHAAAALMALNERLQAIRGSESRSAQTIGAYFNDAVYALKKSGAGSNSLTMGVFYVFGSAITAARLGAGRIYRYTDGMLFRVAATSTGSGDPDGPVCGFDTITDSTDGDVFMLVSEGVTSALSDDDVLEIVNKAPDLKPACKNICVAAEQKNTGKSVSAILIRVRHSADEAYVPAAAAAVSTAANDVIPTADDTVRVDDIRSAAVQNDSVAAVRSRGTDTDETPQTPADDNGAEAPGSADGEEEESFAKSFFKKIFIILGVIVLMLLIVFGTYKITNLIRNIKSGGSDTSESTSIIARSTTVLSTRNNTITTEPATTTLPATTAEATTKATTTKAAAAATAAATTKKSSSSRTNAKTTAAATEAPAPEAPATEAPAQTTAAPETTTAAAEVTPATTAAAEQAPAADNAAVQG